MLGHTAELFVVDELGDGRMVAADRAFGIAPQLQFAELHSQRVVQHQATDERLVLLRPMERRGGRGIWPVAGSLREVEGEVDVVLRDGAEG